MNTIALNRYTQAWRDYGATLSLPRAILVISAHWYVPGIRLTAHVAPATVHDFNANFPPALFAFDYPAPGDPALVERVSELLAPHPVSRDLTAWGLDHGAYSVLAHLFPQARIPVVQLSIDRTKPAAFHYALAGRLAPLRDEGIFVMASGNVVHNLELGDPRRREPFAWALRFDEIVRARVAAGDHLALVDYHRFGADARLSVPTPEHYLPLLYLLALQRDSDRVETIIDGSDFGAGSMVSIGFAP